MHTSLPTLSLKGIIWQISSNIFHSLNKLKNILQYTINQLFQIREIVSDISRLNVAAIYVYCFKGIDVN